MRLRIALALWAALLAGAAHAALFDDDEARKQDRKSTRLNSSHLVISYAVFCLKKKNKNQIAANLDSEQPTCISFGVPLPSQRTIYRRTGGASGPMLSTILHLWPGPTRHAAFS